MQVRAEGTFSSLKGNDFKSRLLWTSAPPLSLLNITQLSWSGASLCLASLCSHFIHVCCFITIQQQQQQKGTIWSFCGIQKEYSCFLVLAAPRKEVLVHCCSLQVTIACVYIVALSSLPSASQIPKVHIAEGGSGKIKPPWQGREIFTATKGVFLCYALSCQAARWADWGLCLPARLHRN